VAGGITDRISLSLDDAPAEPAIIGIMDHYFPNQVTRQFHRIHREFPSTETPKTKKRDSLAYLFHFSMHYCGAPAPSDIGWSSPSIAGMSSETVG
jgi:hypothetical protein